MPCTNMQNGTFLNTVYYIWLNAAIKVVLTFFCEYYDFINNGLSH